jgi:hypothetical protein
MPRWIEWIQAEQEKGWTMPVVPSTDSPPMMPSRGFQVLSASSAPFSMEISISMSAAMPCSAQRSPTTCDIIWRGHRVDGRFADRDRQAGLGDGADAIARLEDDTRTLGQAADARHHECAVGHVGIVAGILDDAGHGPDRRRGFRAPAKRSAVRLWAG